MVASAATRWRGPRKAGGHRKCRCTPDQVSRYQGKLSGPLLDRIDLHIEVAAQPPHEIINAPAPVRPEACADIDPKAAVLMGTLQGCCHPRALRLKARLATCRCGDPLAALQAEVAHLLTLSFGPVEAARRLQALQ